MDDRAAPPAESGEIEVTPEMAAAGARLLGEHDPAHDSWAAKCDLVELIYKTMASLIPLESPSG